ncbi:hypothetical protein [Halovulum sp. GXIMD14793]
MTDTPKDKSDSDVNDVLSSIRELVSQEAKSQAEQAAGKKPEAVEPVQAEDTPESPPLVLGQAERVEKAAEDGKEDSSDAKPGTEEAEDAPRPEPLKMDMASLVAPVAAAVAAVKPAEPASNGSGDAPFYDEAALRVLISEVVREELQGELGERLNRTIRKIARREVLRAIDEDDDDLGGGLKL